MRRDSRYMKGVDYDRYWMDNWGGRGSTAVLNAIKARCASDYHTEGYDNGEFIFNFEPEPVELASSGPSNLKATSLAVIVLL